MKTNGSVSNICDNNKLTKYSVAGNCDNRNVFLSSLLIRNNGAIRGFTIREKRKIKGRPQADTLRFFYLFSFRFCISILDGLMCGRK